MTVPPASPAPYSPAALHPTQPALHPTQPALHPTQPALHPIVARQQLAPAQLEAVLRRGSRLLVVAGAGTGKTKTLTARILHLLAQEESWAAPAAPGGAAIPEIEPGAEPSAEAEFEADATPLRRIAAVTFTNKAARELRARLRGQIAAFLPAAEPGERGRWERLLIDLEAAPIGTIHALCTRILRAHPAEAALDPRFGVLEEGAALGAVQAAIDEALVWAVEDEAGAQLLRLLGADGLRTLCGELVAKRLDAGPALGPAGEEALRAAVLDMRRRMIAFCAHDEVALQVAALRNAGALLQSDARLKSDKLAPYIEQAQAAAQQLDAARAAEDWQALAGALVALRAAMKSSNGVAKLWLPLQPKEAINTLRDLFDAQLPAVVDGNPALDERLLELLPTLRALYARLIAAYSAAKAEQRMLDFDDLEERAIALLQDHAAVRAAWQQQLMALLVDEFQDTNERQRTLIELLSRAGDVQTFVGDPKQSIYRFRGASVEIMQRELAAMAAQAAAAHAAVAQDGAQDGVQDRVQDGAEATGKQAGEVLLSTSYRAHAGLLHLLNLLLAPILQSDANDPLRPPFAPLAPSGTVQARVHGPAVELLLAHGAKKDGALTCAAHQLARRLPALHAAGFAWSEMAILCRTARGFEAYEDAFEAAGVPFVTVAGRGFYDRPEVRDVLNALRALDDPTDNLALLGLLRSPAVGVSDPQLFLLGRLALAQSKGTGRAGPRQMAPGALWAALHAAADTDVQRAAALVADLARLAGRLPVAALIKALYDRTGYAVALTKAGQARAARNLAKLMEDALRTGETSVGAFLARVDTQQKGGAREGEALADAEGVVQIMTVHAAKGLQWPVVVIGDASSAEGGRRSALLLERGGLFLRLHEGKAAPGPLYRAAESYADAAAEAESDRLLYVAATRAEQLLIFSGVYGGKNSAAQRGWLKRLTESLNLEAQLLPLLAQPAGDGSEPLLDGLVAAGAPNLPPDAAALLGTECMVRLQAWACANDLAHADAAPAAEFASAAALAPDAEVALAAFEARAPLWAPLAAPHAAPAAPAPNDSEAPGAPRMDRSVGTVMGHIVHEALAQWRFPPPHADAAFDGWVRARARSQGLTDAEVVENCLARVRRLLLAFAAHPLRAEVEDALERYHALPYDRPPLAPAYEPRPAAGGRLPAAGESGHIELLYRRRKDGRWVVVDFKTNHIEMPQQRAARLGDADFVGPALGAALAVRTLLDEEPETLLVFLDDERRVTLEPLHLD